MSFDVDHVLREATTAELAALVCGAGFWQTAGIALVIANVALLAFRKN